MDVTYADPQAHVHLQAGSADHAGSAASTSEARKRQNYARPGHVSFGERSHKLTTFAVESFGHLGEEGNYSIDQPAASVMGGRRRRVHGEEWGVEGTPLTDRLGDNTGGHFEASVPLQATASRSPRCKKESRGKG